MFRLHSITFAAALVILAALLCMGCGDEDRSEEANSDETNGEPMFSVGGHVSGLEGSGLVLGMNDDYAAHVDDNGPFAFEAELEDESSYDVNVLTQPIDPQQDCDISGGSGIIDGEDVDDIEVACQTPAPAQSATFEVAIDVSSSQLEVGATETVLVAVEVENTAEESGTADIDLVIDDQFEATEQRSVDGLATESLAFEWTTDADDVGTYTAEVSSPDDSDSAPVIVNSPGCEQRTLLGDLSGWSRADDVLQDQSSDPTEYLGVFNGEEFPGTQNNKKFYLPKNQYAALEFEVPENFSDDEEGVWTLTPQTAGLDTYGPGAFMLMSISECPGDFDPDNFDDPGCIRLASCLECNHPTRWTADLAGDRCVIESGETYYLNILFHEPGDIDFPPVQANCNDAPNCGTLIRPR